MVKQLNIFSELICKLSVTGVAELEILDPKPSDPLGIKLMAEPIIVAKL